MPLTKYSDDTGSVYAVRMSAQDIAAAGTPPSGPVDTRLKVKVSRSIGGYGLRPRAVRLTFPANPTATDKIYYKRLPVLTLAQLNQPAFADGATITIGSRAWVVIGSENESFR